MSTLDEIIVRWPDLSAYGIEMVLGLLPEERGFLCVRAKMDTPLEDRPALLEQFAPKLERLGFERHWSGLWTKASTLVLPSIVSEEFPKAVFKDCTMRDVIADLGKPIEEAPAPPSP